MTAAPLARRESPVAILPAAGFARRLGKIAGSKELQGVRAPGGGTARPVIEHVLAALGAAGVERAIVALRAEKRDLPEALGAGDRFGLEIEYVFVPATPHVPATLAYALAQIVDDHVLLAFPDILLTPADAFASAITRYAQSDADLLLGLFPTDQPGKTDMVVLDRGDQPRDIVIKDPACRERFTWSFALWSPAFSLRFAELAQQRPLGEGSELWVGDVLRRALHAGVAASSVCFPGGSYLDIGTPEDLARAR